LELVPGKASATPLQVVLVLLSQLAQELASTKPLRSVSEHAIRICWSTLKIWVLVSRSPQESASVAPFHHGPPSMSDTPSLFLSP
jgi:hypothetical protein